MNVGFEWLVGGYCAQALWAATARGRRGPDAKLQVACRGASVRLMPVCGCVTGERKLSKFRKVLKSSVYALK